MVESLSTGNKQVIIKPRNLYSNNVLRVAVGDIDLNTKKSSITLSKLSIKSNLKIAERTKE